MLFLRTFGGLALEQSENPRRPAAAQRLPLAILSFIAVSGEAGASRDRIAALFWPESDSEHARGSLKQALYFLRHAVGDNDLASGTTTLLLNSAVIRADAAEFAAAFAEKNWEAAVKYYAGPFLDGIHLTGNSEFDWWVERERTRFAGDYAAALTALAKASAAAGDVTASCEWWRKLAATDPLNAKFCRCYMEALAAAGDRHGAIKYARVYITMVRTELETEPDESIVSLVDELLAVSHNSVAASPRGSSVNASTPGPSREIIPSQTPQPTSPLSITQSFRLAAAATVAFAAIVLTSSWFSARDRIDRGETPPALLADVGGSADEEIRRTVGGLLRAALEETNVLMPVGEEDVRHGLALAERPDTLPLDPETARQLAYRGAIRTVVAPTLDKIGRTYALAVRIIDSENGKLIASERATSVGEDSLIAVSDEVVRLLHGKLGAKRGALAAIRPLEEATTASFAAYRFFVRALEMSERGNNAAALRWAREATKLDSSFAPAWLLMGASWANWGRRDSMLTAAEHLELHADRGGVGERLLNRATAATLRSDYSTALELENRYLEESGANPVILNNRAVTLGALGRDEEALASVRSAVEKSRFGPQPQHVFNISQIRSLSGDVRGMLRELDSLSTACGRSCDWVDGPAAQARFAVMMDDWVRADTLSKAGAPMVRIALAGRRGNFEESIAISERMAPPASALNSIEFEHVLAISELLIFQVSGRPWNKPPSLARYPFLDGVAWRGIWEATSGDTIEANRIFRLLTDSLRFRYRGAAPEFIAASVAARGGRWRDVVRILGPVASTRELGRRQYDAWVSSLPIQWAVAQAYEHLGKTDSAAAMYLRLLSPAGYPQLMVLRGIPYSFAQHRLVILYARGGRVADAERHLAILRDSFKHPDSQFKGMVPDAEAELDRARARLKR